MKTKALQRFGLSQRDIALLTVSLFGIAAFSPHAGASGFLMPQATVANAGTAGAGDGVATRSAAAQLINPATMSFQGDNLTTFNVMVLDLNMDYSDNNGGEAGSAHTVMPTLGVFHTHRLNEKWHAGISVGALGGSGVDYGNSWAGAPLLSDINLSVIGISPSVSYQVSEALSLGATLYVNWASMEQSSSALNFEKDSDWSTGYGLGMMYKPEDWAVGLSYRSKLENEFDLDTNLPMGSVSTSTMLPSIVDLSGRYPVSDTVDLLATIQYQRWSEFDKTTLEVGQLSADILREWDDVWRYGIGADIQANEDWRVKVGFAYETSPQDDPALQWVDIPVGEQFHYSLGAETKYKETTIDIYYQFTDMGTVAMDRTIALNNLNVDGRFDGQMHFIGMNVTF